MNAVAWVEMAGVLATDTQVLPSMASMQLWLHVGWMLITVWLASALALRLTSHRAGLWAIAVAVALLAWLPAPLSSAYWLGLAFQAPSLTLVMWCGWQVKDLLFGMTMDNQHAHPLTATPTTILATVGVLCGWILVLDAFAWLPWDVYAWGFSPLAAAVVVALALAPVCAPSSALTATRGWWIAPAAVIAYIGLRLPTGNVWDAVMDPLLWLGLQGYLLHRIRIRYGFNSDSRLSSKPERQV